MNWLERLWGWLFSYQNYNDYLHSQRWRQLRTEALRRDGYACRICAGRWRLQVHHRAYAARWGQERVEDLTTLCAGCHEWVTEGLRQRKAAKDRWKIKYSRT